MIIGVRNEEGIQKISSFYMNKDALALNLVKDVDTKDVSLKNILPKS